MPQPFHMPAIREYAESGSSSELREHDAAAFGVFRLAVTDGGRERHAMCGFAMHTLWQTPLPTTIWQNPVAGCAARNKSCSREERHGDHGNGGGEAVQQPRWRIHVKSLLTIE